MPMPNVCVDDVWGNAFTKILNNSYLQVTHFRERFPCGISILFLLYYLYISCSLFYFLSLMLCVCVCVCVWSVVRGLQIAGMPKPKAKALAKFCSVSVIIGSRHIWRRQCFLYPWSVSWSTCCTVFQACTSIIVCVQELIVKCECK